MALKTYADWEDAVRVARAVYDHSLARMVTRAKTVRKSKKMAFLSAISAKAVDRSGGDSPETDTRKASPLPVRKLQISQKFFKQRSKQCREKRKIQIFVATPLASTVCLQLHPSTPISSVKSLLQDRLGIDPEKQHLFTRNNFELCDALSLEDHCIQQDTNIEMRLVTGLLGGRKKRKKEKAGAKPPSKEVPTVRANAPAEETQDEFQASCAAGPTAGGTSGVTAGVTAGTAGATADATAGATAGAAAGEQRPTSAGGNTEINIEGDHNRVNVKGDQTTYNIYVLPMIMDASNRGQTDDALTNRSYTILQDSASTHEKINVIELLRDIVRKHDGAEIARVAMGSVKFMLHVKSRKGLDSLWAEYSSGKLAQKFSEILVTDELTTGDKSDISIRLTILESDYEKGCRFFESLSTEPTPRELPVRMSDWTKEHVKLWLRSIGLLDSVADQLYEGSMHGKVLQMYRKEHLIEDFGMKMCDARFILYSREIWLESEKQSFAPQLVDQPASQAPDDSKGADHAPAVSQDHADEETSQPAVRLKSSDKKTKTTQATLRDQSPLAVTSEVPTGPRSPEAEEGIRTASSDGDMSQQTAGLREHELIDETDQARALAHLKAGRVSPDTPTDGDKLSECHKQNAETLSRQGSDPSSPSTCEYKHQEGPVTPDRVEIASSPSKNQSIEQAELGAQNHEARLRMLLTGDEHGELDQSYYPVLVANKPLVSSTDVSGVDPIGQQFGFVKTIKWSTVLDFDSNSLSDGLCKLYHDDRMVTLQQPALFKHIESEEELRNSIGFPEKTLWLFTNGREDNPSIQTPRMDLPEWNKERSRDVEATITFFSQPTVIPKGRAMIVFLLLSGDNIGIICDTLRKMSSSFQGLESITCIAEDADIYSKFVSGVERWFSKDEIDARSVVGLKWKEINRIMMRMNGVNQTGDNELPFSLPGKCFLSEKKRDEWNDVTVVCKNECENTDMDESSQDYEKFAKKKELNFYHGEKVDWWNFAIGEKERRFNKSCGHVLKRKGFGEVLRKVNKPLSSTKADDSVIATITLLHQPGAGGSTLARHVLWELHKDQRCIVVNRITSNTVNQIIEFRRYGYSKEHAGNIPPVCVLVDDFDDIEVLDLIGELEEASRDTPLTGGAVCVLLHCKRDMDPHKTINDLKNDRELYIPLIQKLDQTEKEWFQLKYLELEAKESRLKTGDYNPDNLLAFMVMKEEFNKEYIRDVVSRILHDDIKAKEISLIKLCAFLKSYMDEGEIPISCCDSFMTSELKPRKTTYLTRKSSINWEKLVSASFKIIVVMTENRTIKIIHKSIAEEALRQTLKMSGNQSLAEVTLEFLNSELLRSPSHSRKDLAQTTHDLLIRRTRLRAGDDSKTNFSGLIEEVCRNRRQGPNKAIEILETGFKKLEDAFVAQHLARLYLKEKNFRMAHIFADKALEIKPKKTYFWDTKGRISQTHLKTLSAPYVAEQQVIDVEVCKEIICVSFQAMDAFRKSYDFSKEAMQTEYSGLYALVDVAISLLHVIFLCVEPFRTKGDWNIFRAYLLNLSLPTDSKPNWDNDCHSRIGELKHRVESVLQIMDDNVTYYKDGSSANIVGEKLEEMRENMRRYSYTYEKYYGEPLPFDEGRYIDQDSKSLAECRRRKVKRLQCGRFSDVFDLARENRPEVLEESRKLLFENSSDYNFFDLNILVCIHLALSSIGKPLMSADDVYQQLVRPLNALDQSKNGCWAPFVMMMFLWPIPDTASERRDREDLICHIEKLKNRSGIGHNVRGLQSRRHEKVTGHTRFTVKPRTPFFLGNGKDLEVFVHVNEILATQSKLDRHDGNDTFWQSSTVRKRLVRLEGILLNNTSLVHRSHKDKKIAIKLAVPSLKHTPSQETVTFYLGFSWSGPVAYNVTPLGKESCDYTVPRSFDQAYPKHILPPRKSKASLSDNIFKIEALQKKCHELMSDFNDLQCSLQACSKLKSNESQALEIKRKMASKQRELESKTAELKRAWQEDTF